MSSVINFLGQLVIYFMKFLVGHLLLLADDLLKNKDNISFKNLVTDFFSVLINASMLLVLNLFALLAFIVLPQGKDIVLLVAEGVGVEHRFGNFLWLLAGIILWSIIAEFASRYAVYVSDNSGNSISADRVKWRKAVQRTMSNVFLLMPYVIVLISFGVCYINDTSLTGMSEKIGFGVPALLIYVAMNVVIIFYFSNEEIDNELNKLKNKDGLKIYVTLLNAIKRLRKFIGDGFGRSDDEFKWCGKLVGIYNDHVFTIRKPENFVNDARTYERELSGLFASNTLGNDFPRRKEYIQAESLVPGEFELKKFGQEPEMNGQFHWIYRIPNSFYKGLHRQLLSIVILCLLAFAIICFLPIGTYERIGSPGLLMLAFSCWSGLYLGVLFLDYAVFRPQLKKSIANRVFSSISVRVLLVALLLYSSYANDDHPVRYNQVAASDERPCLKEHFENWFANYAHNPKHKAYREVSGDTTPFYPVIFVCAEGGALRTGAYTSLLLSFLEDSLAQRRDSIDFKGSIYAFSGVSGGSLGVGYFNTIAYLNSGYGYTGGSKLSKLSNDFFSNDYLAPVIGKMFYGDIFNLFLPWHIEKCDRAIALEKAWEKGFPASANPDAHDILADNFLSLYRGIHPYPALFINTTEVETGRQCWVSNVRPEPDMYLPYERDLFNYKIRGGINYSTAINFSSRFPLVSPAATLLGGEGHKSHYVDGGYVENTGTGTMLEIISELSPVMDSLYQVYHARIRPYVLVIRYGNTKDAGWQNINFANEISEILYGIYDTRSGRTELAVAQLQKYVKEMKGDSKSIDLDLNNDKVPMNWTLSQQSLNNIDTFVTKLMWKSKDGYALDKFFKFYFDSTYRRVDPAKFIPIKDSCKRSVVWVDTVKADKAIKAGEM